MRTLRKLKIIAILSGNLTFSASIIGGTAEANDFTAEKVMKEMKSEERTAYLAGVIEGLAVARYFKDAKSKTGMNCIYDWFYQDKTTLRIIHDSFDKYPAYPPGAVMDVLVKRKCGE